MAEQPEAYKELMVFSCQLGGLSLQITRYIPRPADMAADAPPVMYAPSEPALSRPLPAPAPEPDISSLELEVDEPPEEPASPADDPPASTRPAKKSSAKKKGCRKCRQQRQDDLDHLRQRWGLHHLWQADANHKTECPRGMHVDVVQAPGADVQVVSLFSEESSDVDADPDWLP